MGRTRAAVASAAGSLPVLLLSLSSVLLLLLSSAALPTAADEHDHRYRQGEGVVLWANKVGPYHNPSESYSYFSLPGCPQLRTRPLQTESSSLGVLLEGDTLSDTGISLPFRRPVNSARICDFTLDDPNVLAQLNYAVENHYWFELVIDELPAYGMLGEYIDAEEMRAELAAAEAAAGGSAAAATTAAAAITAAAQGFIYTHKDFLISYSESGDQIVQVDLTSENPRPLLLNERYQFTYSVTWKPSSAPFATRFERYHAGAAGFFNDSIHWIALFNSFMMVVFLCGLVLLVLNRAVKHSLIHGAEIKASPSAASASAAKDPESGRLLPGGSSGGGDGEVEEGRWRLLVGDVFRAPSHLRLYCVLLGTGVQLLFLLIAVLFVAVLSSTRASGDSDDKSTLLTLLGLMIYALSSGAQGYVSGAYFKQHNSSPQAWRGTMLLSALFYPSLVLGVVVFLNALSLMQGTVPVLSASTIAVLAVVWLCVSAPLTLAGTLWARSRTQTGVFPCRVNAIRRLIPSENPVGSVSGLSGAASSSAASASSWYTSWWVLLAASGVLPFGSVFIELYFVMVSFWNRSFVYVYGFLLLVLLMLLVVSACVAIVSTYLLLNAEDYRWVHFSFSAGATWAVWMAAYAVYYFVFKTNMSGVLQTAVFFSYAFLALTALGLITGAAASVATRWFVTRIYSYTKAD